MSKITIRYENKDIEHGPYYEAWIHPHNKMVVRAEGKTEKQALMALKKSVKNKIKESLRVAGFYQDDVYDIALKIGERDKC